MIVTLSREDAQELFDNMDAPAADAGEPEWLSGLAVTPWNERARERYKSFPEDIVADEDAEDRLKALERVLSLAWSFVDPRPVLANRDDRERLKYLIAAMSRAAGSADGGEGK